MQKGVRPDDKTTHPAKRPAVENTPHTGTIRGIPLFRTALKGDKGD